MKLFEKYQEAIPKQYRATISASIIGIFVFPIIFWIVDTYVMPCKCANLTEQSPMASSNRDNYTAGDWNNASDPTGKIQGDVDDFISLAKKCANRYGELDDYQKEAMKSSLNTDYIPFSIIMSNASKECN